MPQQHQWYGNIRNDSLDATFQWRKWLSSTVSWPLASFSAAWSSERRPQQKFSWDRCVRGTASVRVRYLVSGDDFSIFFLWSACEKKNETQEQHQHIYISYIFETWFVFVLPDLIPCVPTLSISFPPSHDVYNWFTTQKIVPASMNRRITVAFGWCNSNHDFWSTP